MPSRVEAIIKRSPVALLMMRHKKHADLQLYQVLADCMEIAEVCLSDIGEYEVLNKLIGELPIVEGKTRQYVERSSDIYQRTCRFMFHGEEHTANVNRYAHCLREAAKQQVTSKALIKELVDGGINKFFHMRPSQNQEREVATKCLRLDRQIRHYKSAIIRLQLRRTVEGAYEVLEFSDGIEMHPRSGIAARRDRPRNHRAS
jgi:hypothetical protein